MRFGEFKSALEKWVTLEKFGEVWRDMQHLGMFVKVKKSFAGFWSDLEGLGECQRVKRIWESLKLLGRV